MVSTPDLNLFATLALRGWFPLWLAIVLAILAVVGVVALYISEARRVPLPVRLVLGTLRICLLLAVLFLVLRPTWLTETKGDRRRDVYLFIDDTLSMSTADPRPNIPDRWRTGIALDAIPPDRGIPTDLTSASLPANIPSGGPESPWMTRLEVAKKTLSNPRLDLLEQFKKVGRLKVSTFGEKKSEKSPEDRTWMESISGKQERTALADALYDVISKDENELPAAIFIVTDGRENSSTHSLDEIARECQRLQVPLHIYGVGSSSFGQFQIRDVQVQDTLFVDDTASVPVRYRVRGFKEGKITFTVKLNGQEVATRTIDAKEGDDLREMLTFVPQKRDAQPGKQELTTTVQVQVGNETYPDEITKGVRVIDRKVKILMMDSNPRWDFKFIQRGLMRDRRVEARFFLTEGDPRAMKSGEPFIAQFPATRQELFAYDLLIIGDLPIASLTKEQQNWIREFVVEGGGLIQIAGRGHGPASFLGTPLGDILPVEYESVKFPIDPGVRQQGYRPELTSPGTRSMILSLDDNPVESLRIWRTLPELYWHYPVTKLKPGAEVYLAHPTAKTTDNKPMPLLASHYYGKGYVLFSAIDETWRWRFNEADKFFYRFWSQAIYIAGVSRTLGTKSTQLSLDTPDAVLGKTGQVYARLLTPDLKPITAERVEARVERLDVGDDKDKFTNVELKAMPGQPGEFIAAIPFNHTGRFALKVENGTEPGVLEYRVALPPGHERAPGGLAEEEMRKLAESTGGKFYREEDLHTVPNHLKTKTTPFVQREEILLWNHWAMIIVISLFCLEWFIRKFNSMS